MSLLRFGTSLFALRGAFIGVGNGVPTSSGTVYAKTFNVDISPSSSKVGGTIIVTVTPVEGAWPSNQAVVGIYSGTGASFSSLSVVAGSSSSFSFTGTVGTVGTGTIDATMSGLTSTGGKSYSATAAAVVTPPPTPTTNANRFDVAFAKSAMAPGGTLAGSIYPTNGRWSAAGNIVLTPSNGDPAITVAVPTFGNGTVAFTYTAGSNAKGTVRFAVSNTAGLVNCEPPTLTVFSPSSGSVASLSANCVNQDLEGYQRATPSGDPTGFSLWNKGWGRVLLTMTGSGSAIWMRPHAVDPNATGQRAAGAGAQLHAPVQVYGAFTAGRIEVLLPAGIPWVDWDIAGDQAMTNASRIPQRIRVGHVIMLLGRSILNTVVTMYAYGSFPPFPYPNQNTTTMGTGNAHSNGDPTGQVGLAMLQYDVNSMDSTGYRASSAAMELGRLVEADLGVGLTIKWICENGQPTGDALDHDGNFTGTMPASLYGYPGTDSGGLTRTGYRELMTGWSVNGNQEWHDTTYANTLGERIRRYTGMVTKVALQVPSCAVIGLCDCGEGWNGGDGSRGDESFPGPIRIQVGISERIAAINPMVLSRFNSNWNANYGGHPTMGVRPQISRAMHQTYLQGEHAAWGGLQIPYGQRGPTLWSTAQWVPASNTIRWFGNLNGGGSLQAFLFTGTDQNFGTSQGTPSPAQLASIVGVFSGYPSHFGSGDLLETTGMTISTANLPTNADFSLDITLHIVNGQAVYAPVSGGGPAPIPTDFTLQYGEFGSSCGALKAYDGPAAFITDTAHISTTNGVIFGFEMNPANDAHAR